MDVDGDVVHCDSCVIHTSGLTKLFKQRVIVDSLDLCVPEGSIAGFVGPNGAGKTTTIRMLMGLVKPSAGGGRVLGQSIYHSGRYLAQVGALIEGPMMYPELSGYDNLKVLACLGRIPISNIGGVLERVGLWDRRNDLFRVYSLGMKQKLGIAAALLSSPRLLILDEPTNGLDPLGIMEMRDLLYSLNQEGMTILVSSHLLSEIEQVSDYLVVIRGGRQVYQGRMEDLLATQQSQIIVRIEERRYIQQLIKILEQHGKRYYELDTVDGWSVGIFAPSAWTAALNQLTSSEGIHLSHLSVKQPSLEEILLDMLSSASV